MRIRLILLVLFIVLVNHDLFADSFDKSNTDSTLSSLNDYSINIARETQTQNFDSAESILLTANHLADSLINTRNLQIVDNILKVVNESKVQGLDSSEIIFLRNYNFSESDLTGQDNIDTLIQLGQLYFSGGYFETSANLINELLQEYSDELSEIQVAKNKHILGLNNIMFSNYNLSINYFQQALAYYEKYNMKAEIAKALKDIGVVYYYLRNENLALDNYQKALLIYIEVNDSDGIARSYNNIGMIFKDKGNIPMALDYLNKSLEIKKNQKNQYGIGNTLGNIGDAYMANDEDDKAIEYFNRALSMWMDMEHLNGITEVFNYLGAVYIKKGMYDLAIKNLTMGQEISLNNNFKQYLIISYELLSEAYYKKEDYKNSVINYKKYSQLNDSFYSDITNQKIKEYLTNNEKLKAENELIVQDKKITQQRYQIIASFIILFIVITFLFIIIRQNRAIRRKSRKIQNINKELDKRVAQKTSELRISGFSIDIAVDAIIWMKRNGKIVYVNNAACLMLGYSKTELNKMSIFNLVAEFSEDVWQEYWTQLKKKKSYVIQLYYKTRMGSEIPVEVAFNFQDFEGEEFNFTYSRNITERKLAEEKLKNAKEKAEYSDKLKSAFLANMSHEIRTPMNAISGFINLLGDSDINEEQKKEIIELAQSSSNDLLNIVNDIIDISKIEANELIINKSLNYVNRIVAEFYKFYLKDINLLYKENVKLRMEIEPNSDKIAIYTDLARFRQVMSNLVSNAIKFTEKGEIVIGYNLVSLGNRKLLRFFVKDTGIGIPKQDQDAVFDRFNQLNDNRTKDYKSTGLGLSIAKKLVDLLGGNIGLVSEEGEGSDFYFTLPYQLLETSDTPINIDTYKKELDDWSHKSILVVEDTESNYYLIENYLKNTNIQLSWVKSGREALELFNEKKKFDLVLMDIQLPGMNGYEVSRLVKAYNKEMPVIAQTAYALAGEKERSIKEGCDDYISKPIKKEALIELLRNYLQ